MKYLWFLQILKYHWLEYTIHSYALRVSYAVATKMQNILIEYTTKLNGLKYSTNSQQTLALAT